MARIKTCGIFFWTILGLLHVGLKVSAQTTPSSSTAVSLPPSLTLNPGSSVIFKSGAQISLPCGAIGTPTPAYSWTFNGISLAIDGKTIQYQNQGTILISSPDASNQGYYQCAATNNWGTAFSITSFVEMAIISFPTLSTGSHSVNQSQPMLLPCNSPTSIPNGIISWATAPNTTSPNVTAVPLSPRISIDQSGNLLFANVLPSDATTGTVVYLCMMFNPFLQTTQGGSFTSLLVTAVNNPSNTAPAAASYTPSPATAIFGGSISLFCSFSGYPTPAITWPTTLPSGRYTLSPYNNTLTITNVQQSDAMDYTCQGTNSMGTKNIIITVNVNISPYFQSPSDELTNVNVTIGQSVSFICKAQSYPSAQIIWFQNGKSLSTTSPPSRYSFSTDLTNLTISNVCKTCSNATTDMSVIQCNISNSNGYAFAQGYLNLLEATSISTTPSNQTIVSGSTIMLNCSANSDPSTPVTIYWLFNDQNITYNSNIYTDSSGYLIINTKGAPNGGAGYAGAYTCVASNGYSTASVTYNLYAPIAIVQSAGSYWYVFLIIGLLLLLLLLFLCWWCTKNNEGDTYPVDDQEKKNGNDPEQEIKDTDFQAFQRPDKLQTTAAPNRNSWTSIQFGSEANGSIAGYSNIDGGKFNEEGSFIGQYAQQNPLKSAARLAPIEDDGYSYTEQDRGYSSMDRQLDVPTVSAQIGSNRDQVDNPADNAEIQYSSNRHLNENRAQDYDNNEWPQAPNHDNNAMQYADIYQPSRQTPEVRYTSSPVERSFDGAIPPAVPRRRSRPSPVGFPEPNPYFPGENSGVPFSAALTLTGPAGNQITFTSDRNLNENGQDYLEEERIHDPYGQDMRVQGSIHSIDRFGGDIGDESAV